MGLHSLSKDRQLHKVIHLSFRALNVLLVHIWQFSEDLMRLLLEFKCLPVISELVVSMSDGLIRRNYLEMLLSE